LALSAELSPEKKVSFPSWRTATHIPSCIPLDQSLTSHNIPRATLGTSCAH
jgi:hypothetical protein